MFQYILSKINLDCQTTITFTENAITFSKNSLHVSVISIWEIDNMTNHTEIIRKIKHQNFKTN